ncbi:HAD-superfamily hydrolase, subfamily IIA [Chytriomyces cf. hyalinus JEL632]|nr:HAD-superfamily hydrolase, subfamily IIA [Chytriomyces cf. hyalinus JEL632]
MISTRFSAAELSEMTEVTDQAYADRLTAIKAKKGFIIDMDGVIYHGSQLLPGAKEFVDWLISENKQFLFLSPGPLNASFTQTNNSTPTPKELSEKLHRMGLDIPPTNFYTSGNKPLCVKKHVSPTSCYLTSPTIHTHTHTHTTIKHTAIATAKFLQSQKPAGGKVFALGGPGLTYALYEHGFTMSETKPDYVVIGTEGTSHNFEGLQKALSLITKDGAKLIGTNPDSNGVKENGEKVLGTGAFLALLEVASGKKAFTCGKPSSLMMSYATTYLGLPKEDTCIVGDRMDTDILAGTNAQIDPVLVMSGVTDMNNLFDDAYRPYLILNGVGELVN